MNIELLYKEILAKTGVIRTLDESIEDMNKRKSRKLKEGIRNKIQMLSDVFGIVTDGHEHYVTYNSNMYYDFERYFKEVEKVPFISMRDKAEMTVIADDEPQTACTSRSL